MAAFSGPIGPNLVLSPFSVGRRRPLWGRPVPCFIVPRGSYGVARLGLGQVQFPDPESAGVMVKHLFERTEGFLYTLADAAVSTATTTTTETVTATPAKQDGDWLSGITNAMEVVLKVLKDGLSTLHVPYAYGFAIILLTILVKGATYPLTKKQVESAMAMQSLTPQIKAIQERYAGDPEKIQLETARIYKLAGVNPLAGCLPTLATIPIWIGLYRALSNVANEGLLNECFFWIPSLAGPTTIAARQTGSGTTWLFPFVDGHPPLGWSDSLAYLVLPVLLVVSQYISVQLMQPPQSNDPNVKSTQAITKLLPLMIGYFALSVPSGLSLYWFTNNILSTAQQVWLRKMGGAKNPVLKDFSVDDFKKAQSQVLNSISEAPVAKKVIKQEEKLTPEGLRPGDRFKALKEQEAQKKKEREKAGDRFKALKEQEAQKKRDREEASMKVEETEATGIHTTKDEMTSKTDTDEREGSHDDSPSVKSDFVNGGSTSSNSDTFAVNGNSTNSKLHNHDEGTSISKEDWKSRDISDN